MNLTFNRRFVPAIMSGAKRHTIRRGYRWRPGMAIHMLTGPRFAPERFNEGRPELSTCTAVNNVRMYYRMGEPHVAIEGRELSRDEVDALAAADGLSNARGFWLWFESSGLPFEGQIVHWAGSGY